MGRSSGASGSPIEPAPPPTKAGSHITLELGGGESTFAEGAGGAGGLAEETVRETRAVEDVEAAGAFRTDVELIPTIHGSNNGVSERAAGAAGPTELETCSVSGRWEAAPVTGAEVEASIWRLAAAALRRVASLSLICLRGQKSGQNWGLIEKVWWK